MGQIIAVTVGATSIVESLYIEKGNLRLNCAVLGLSILTDTREGIEDSSEHRFWPGWRVIKSFVRPTTGLGDLGMHHISPTEAAKGTLDDSVAATEIYETHTS